MEGRVHIVILVCMISTPDTCEERRLNVDYLGGTPGMCVQASPPSLAAWRMRHPQWRIKRWTCRDDDREQVI